MPWIVGCKPPGSTKARLCAGPFFGFFAKQNAKDALMACGKGHRMRYVTRKEARQLIRTGHDKR